MAVSFGAWHRDMYMQISPLSIERRDEEGAGGAVASDGDMDRQEGRRLPAYERIKAAIRTRIREGEWGPGEPIPGESELAASFGVSRLTAHRALRELAREGVIERRRRRGSRVAVRTGRDIVLEIPRIERLVAQLGAAYELRLLARRTLVPPAPIRERLELPAGERALHLLLVHLADRRPFQLEDRWINLLAVPEAVAADFTAIAPGSWLLEHVPWSEAEHVIAAENADPATAAALDIRPGDAVLVIERRTRNRNRVVTWARFRHPGASYRLATAFAPRS